MLRKKPDLRNLLRRFPWWAGGHILLGEEYLHSVRIGAHRADARTSDARDLALIKLSAEAALRLFGRTTRDLEIASESFTRWELRGFYLAAASQTLSKRYDEALAILRPLVQSLCRQSRYPQTLNLVLEEASIAALAIGNEEEGRGFLSRIPEHKRSVNVAAMLKTLDAL